MTKPRNVAREIILSLIAAAAFGSGLYAYISSSIPVITGSQLIAPPSTAPGPDDLQLAGAVAARFVAAVAAGHHADAYALMASAYRERHSLSQFRAQCAASEYLAHSERIAVSRTHRTVPPGTSASSASLQAQGALVSALGSIDATLTLISESPGEPRILVLALAGIPILDGVSAQR